MFVIQILPNMQKERLREIIFGYNTPEGKLFDIFLILLILLSVIGVILDPQQETLIEWLFTGIFTIEYGLRVYSAPNRRKYILSFMGIIDLLAILPTYLMFIYPPIGGMIAIRVVRLIRVFRVLELSAYLRGAYTMQIALRSSRPKITVFLLTISIIVTILGTVMYIVEGQQNGFESIGKAIYWAITTITTVGYGDIVPHTVIGKILASFMMILGYAIIAVPTGIVSAEFASQRASRRHRDKIIAKEDQIMAKEDQIMAKEDQIIRHIKKLEEKINDLTK